MFSFNRCFFFGGGSKNSQLFVMYLAITNDLSYANEVQTTYQKLSIVLGAQCYF